MKKIKRLIVFIVLVTASCAQQNKEQDSEKEKLGDTEYLIAVLDTVWKTEQRPITVRDSLMKVYGPESMEVEKQQQIYKQNHKVNEKKVLAILDRQGWPNEHLIGYQGSLIICNVIQHSANEVRLKYLPMMKAAVSDAKLHPRLLARAEDRLATDRGDLQVYGGQIKYYPKTKSFDVWPIVDPENVDKRRAAIGLGPIAEFLANRRTPLVWKLEEQLKRTEEFKQQKQVQNIGQQNPR